MFSNLEKSNTQGNKLSQIPFSFYVNVFKLKKTICVYHLIFVFNKIVFNG